MQKYYQKDGASSQWYTIHLDTLGRAILELNNGVGANSLVNLRDNMWHNVVGVIDRSDSTASIYIDGIYKNKITFSASVYNTDNLAIGGWLGPENFNGDIDDVRIYNRALSANDVKALYDVYWGE